MYRNPACAPDIAGSVKKCSLKTVAVSIALQELLSHDLEEFLKLPRTQRWSKQGVVCVARELAVGVSADPLKERWLRISVCRTHHHPRARQRPVGFTAAVRQLASPAGRCVVPALQFALASP